MMKVASKKTTGVFETSHTFKILAIMILCLGIFFSLLFFVYDSATSASTGSGMRSDTYSFMVANTTLAFVLVCMEFYTTRVRIVNALRYGIVLTILGFSGYLVHLLTRGADEKPFSDDGDGKDVSFAYASLATGFVGTGAVLAFVYNFHNITHSY